MSVSTPQKCPHNSPELYLCLADSCEDPIACPNCLITKHEHNWQYKYRNLTPGEIRAYEFQPLIIERFRLESELKRKYVQEREDLLKELQSREQRRQQDLDSIISADIAARLKSKFQGLFSRVQNSLHAGTMLVQGESGTPEDTEIQNLEDRNRVMHKLKEFEVKLARSENGIKQEDSTKIVVRRLKSTKPQPNVGLPVIIQEGPHLYPNRDANLLSSGVTYFPTSDRMQIDSD